MAENKTEERQAAPEQAQPEGDSKWGGRFAPDGKTPIDAQGRPVADEPVLGAHGIGFASAERAGGAAVKEELRPDPPEDATLNPLRHQVRYVKSRLRREAGDVIARAPENIGLYGKGDTYRGVGIVVDIDSMEKVRVYDGYKFEGDEVYANSRDLPQALVEGEITRNLSGKA